MQKERKAPNNTQNKVLVLGFPVDRQAELEYALEEGLMDKFRSPTFVATPEEVMTKIAGVGVIAVNVDMCGDFIEKLFKRGYEGHAPMTSRKEQRSKIVSIPGKKGVFPTTFRGAADEIIAALSKAKSRSSENLATA